METTIYSKLTFEEFKAKLDEAMQEFRKLSSENQELVMKKVKESKRTDFLHDAHMLDWLQNEIEWYKAFEA